jgi:CRP/FNR family transcriptional regulator, cyclic AMP receptor protein
MPSPNRVSEPEPDTRREMAYFIQLRRGVLDTPGPSRQEPNVIGTGKLRSRFGGFSGIKHGSKAIRGTADARDVFFLPIPRTAGHSRSSSQRVLTTLAQAQRRAAMSKPPKDMFDAKTFLAKVGDGKAMLELHKNQKIFEQGDAAETIFYIQKGKVKLTVLSEQGKEAVVAILEPGHFFGEGCMNGHRLRISTTTAMEDCVITSITKTAMISALHDEPKFSEMFMAYLLTRNSRIEEDLIDQLFNSSERRLARLLLLLANFGKEDEPQRISPNISQETLAEMVGTTRSRVSHFMNKFRKLGLITYNGHIEVNNSLLSAVLHEKPALKEPD